MAGNTFIHGAVVQFKQLATDPSVATNGSIYYNTTLGKLRVYQNGSWDDAGITDHNNLGSIQGGQSGQYNHLTNAEYSGTGTGTFVRASSPSITTPTIVNSLDVQSSGVTEIKLDAANSKIDIKSGAASHTSIGAQATSSDVAFNLPANNGSTGQFLKTDGSGNLSWDVVSTTLTGKALNSGEIIVGNASNVSAVVDTDTIGDITASSTAGLTLKNDVIGNTHIASGAAIARSKIATGSAYRLVSNDATGAMSDLPAITAARALVSDVNGLPVHSSVTAVELGYLSGVTNSIQTQLGSKLSLSGGSMGGNIAMNNNRITGLGDPVDATDAATKGYVDNALVGLDIQKDVYDVVANASTTEAPPSPTAGMRFILVSGTGSLHVSWGAIAGVGNNDIVEYNGTSWFVSYDVSVKGAGALAWNTTAGYFLRWDGISWDEFGGLAGITAGTGLSKSGNTLNINLGAGIQQLPTDEVGVDLFTNGGLILTIDGTNASTDTDAQLAVKVDGSTLTKGSQGLYIKDGGVSNTQIASGAAIDLSKLATVTASRALVSNGSGQISASSVTSTELGYLSGVSSSIQTQLSNKASTDLSNLTATSIGQSLIAATTNSVDLGSSSKVWANAYIGSVAIGSDIHANGTNELSLVADVHNTTAGAINLTANGAASSIGLTANSINLGSIAKVGSDVLKIENPSYSGSGTDLASFKSTIPSSQSSFLDVFTHATAKSVVFEYSLVEAVTGVVRTGSIFASKNAVDNSIGFFDNYGETAVVGNGIEFNVANASGSMKLQVKGTGTNAADLKFFAKILA